MAQTSASEKVIPVLAPETLDFDELTAIAVLNGLTREADDGLVDLDEGQCSETPQHTFQTARQPEDSEEPGRTPSQKVKPIGKQCLHTNVPKAKASPPIVRDRKTFKDGRAPFAPKIGRPHAKDNLRRRQKAKESAKKRAFKTAEISWTRVTRDQVEEKHIQLSMPIAIETDAKDLPVAQGAYWGQRSSDVPDIFPGASSDDAEVCAESVPPSDEPALPSCETSPLEHVADPVLLSDEPSPPGSGASPLEHIADPEVKQKLSDLIQNRNFRYQAWQADVSHPVLDAKKRVVAVLVGKPKSQPYNDAMKRLFDLLVGVGGSETFTKEEQNHRRGQFPALNLGISVGPGAITVSRIQVGAHEELVEKLLQNDDLKRLASHQDASFHAWAPKLHNEYTRMNRALIRGMSERRVRLSNNFTRSVYSSMAINFPVGSKSVCTVPHRDVLNLPYGWCAVHALGNFDATAGGHIILWELKLIVEFPPGACILLPSATVTHFNVPVQPGDLRASITQYTGGNLFRFVDNGFITDSKFHSTKPKVFQQVLEERKKRWMAGLNLLSKYDEESKRFY